MTHFNPRIREGCDIEKGYCMSTILIHTPMRNAINNNGVVAKPFYKGKSCYTSIRFSVKYSNSTHPRGMRPAYNLASKQGGIVLIHAPMKDAIVADNHPAVVIQF